MNCEGMKNQRNLRRFGFTLMELLVVISIMSILIASMLVGYGRVQRMAFASTSTSLASQVATVWGTYLLRNRTWPEGVSFENGVDTDICRILGGGYEPTPGRAKYRYMDLSYPGMDTATIDESKNIEVRWGLLDSWGQRLAKQGRLTAAEADRRRIQFALDLNYDGLINSEDSGLLPAGVEIRASAAAWSWGVDGKPAGAIDVEFFRKLSTKSW